MLDGLDHQTCCFPDSELRTLLVDIAEFYVSRVY